MEDALGTQEALRALHAADRAQGSPEQDPVEARQDAQHPMLMAFHEGSQGRSFP